MIIYQGKSNFIWLGYSAVAITAGILTLVNPFSTEIYSLVMGAATGVLGILTLLFYYFTKKLVPEAGTLQLNGFFSIVIAVMCLATAGTSNLLTVSYFIIIWLMLLGCSRINYALLVQKTHKEWLLLMIAGMLVLALGIFNIVFSNDLNIIYLIMGINIIISGVWSLTTFVYNLIKR